MKWGKEIESEDEKTASYRSMDFIRNISGSALLFPVLLSVAAVIVATAPFAVFNDYVYRTGGIAENDFDGVLAARDDDGRGENRLGNENRGKNFFSAVRQDFFRVRGERVSDFVCERAGRDFHDRKHAAFNDSCFVLSFNLRAVRELLHGNGAPVFPCVRSRVCGPQLRRRGALP